MQISTPLLFLARTVLTIASPANLLRDLAGGLQVPIVTYNEPITRTQTVTHTHLEINVVSTVYKARPQPTAVQVPAGFEHAEEVVPVWKSQPENSKCNLKACAVCRVVNNCGETSGKCPDCDRAEYCQQCTPRTEMISFDELVVESHSECLVVAGREVGCNLESTTREHHIEAMVNQS